MMVSSKTDKTKKKTSGRKTKVKSVSATKKNEIEDGGEVIEAELVEDDSSPETLVSSALVRTDEGAGEAIDPEIVYDDEESSLEAQGEADLDVEPPDKDLEPADYGLVPSSPLSRYLSELRRYDLLTREEEQELALAAYEEDDVESRNRLVTSNLRLVVKIAMEYRRNYVQVLDLIQEGNAGLVQAVNRFNPYRNVKLSTYSAWWIRAYILKFLMDNKSMVRMGTTDAQRKLFFNLRKEAERVYALTQKYDTKAIAGSIGVKESEVVEMQQRLMSDVSFDAPVDESGETRMVDRYSSEELPADTKFEKEQLRLLIKKSADAVLGGLNERDAYIFENRLMSEEPITLQEVGDKYGISRERARQLESRVVKKIKVELESKGLVKGEL